MGLFKVLNLTMSTDNWKAYHKSCLQLQLGLSSCGWFDLTKWLDKLLNLKFLGGIISLLLHFRFLGALIWCCFWFVKIENNGRGWKPSCPCCLPASLSTLESFLTFLSLHTLAFEKESSTKYFLLFDGWSQLKFELWSGRLCFNFSLFLF